MMSKELFRNCEAGFASHDDIMKGTSRESTTYVASDEVLKGEGWVNMTSFVCDLS